MSIARTRCQVDVNVNLVSCHKRNVPCFNNDLACFLSNNAIHK